MNNTAIYLTADPLTFNDLDLVQKTVQTFGFTYIFLDRKNRDSEYTEYILSYSDRVDVLKHDLASRRVTQVKIVPIDTTIQDVLEKNSISTLVLNLDYQANSSFKMLKILHDVCPSVNVLCMQADNFIDRSMLQAVIDSDSSMKLYKRYCSDYSFFKLKVKTTSKIGLTGSFGGNCDIVADELEAHGYVVLDLDNDLQTKFHDSKFLADLKAEFRAAGISSSHLFSMNHETLEMTLDICKIIKESLEDDRIYKIFERKIYTFMTEDIARTLVKTYSNVIVIKSMLIYEFAMEKIFKRIIVVKASEELQRANLKEKGLKSQFIDNLIKIQIPNDEKCSFADDVLVGSKPEHELRADVSFLISKSGKHIA